MRDRHLGRDVPAVSYTHFIPAVTKSGFSPETLDGRTMSATALRYVGQSRFPHDYMLYNSPNIRCAGQYEFSGPLRQQRRHSHRGVETQGLVEHRMQVLHVAHIIVGRSMRRPDHAQDLVAEALQDIWMLGKAVDRERQRARRSVPRPARRMLSVSSCMIV